MARSEYSNMTDIEKGGSMAFQDLEHLEAPEYDEEEFVRAVVCDTVKPVGPEHPFGHLYEDTYLAHYATYEERNEARRQGWYERRPGAWYSPYEMCEVFEASEAMERGESRRVDMLPF